MPNAHPAATVPAAATRSVVTEDAVDAFTARVFSGLGTYAEALVVAALWAARDRLSAERVAS